MEDKINAIWTLDLEESAKKIALELGVGKSTMRNWKNNSSEIEQWCSNQTYESCLLYTSRCV